MTKIPISKEMIGRWKYLVECDFHNTDVIRMLRAQAKREGNDELRKELDRLLPLSLEKDKKYKNKIYSCKTVRDKNFLALSSRNSLLSKNEFNKAGLIAKYLSKLKSSLKKNNVDHNDILIKKKELQKKFNIKIDYLEIRNEKNLTSLIKNKKIRLFVAYYINKVRLIDNF